MQTDPLAPTPRIRERTQDEEKAASLTSQVRSTLESLVARTTDQGDREALADALESLRWVERCLADLGTAEPGEPVGADGEQER